MLFSYLEHRHACKTKWQERKDRVAKLTPAFYERCNANDTRILDTPISTLVASVQSGQTDPIDILRAYGKKAMQANAATNCLTEIMLSSAEIWAKECNRQGPLAGIPVSVKDTVNIKGWDSCIGYLARVCQPAKQDAAIIRLLRDAGAVPYVKTNIPVTLLSFESTNSVFGRSTNPHNKAYSPGGSSGGEAALLAFGGSRIGIGTDVAGSVRVPAHYSGVYAIRSSVGRFLKMGGATSMPGQEGVAAVQSPMARTLEDLETFWKAVFMMGPWKYDPSVLPIPWRDVDLSSKTVRWGVMWDDGVVLPSPACKRALQAVVDTLSKHGHQVVDINPPSPYESLKIAAQLLLGDGGKTAVAPIHSGEANDAGVRQAMIMFNLPRWVKRAYAWYLRHVRRDEVYAGLVEGWHTQSVAEYWALVARREQYRVEWHEMWEREQLDFVLTVPNALPAVPHGGMREGFKACGYTFLFNLLDYSAGVLPITHVSAALDKLVGFKARNAIEKGAFKMYDAVKMDGLPVGVQVVGRRLEEEKVMEGMKIVESLLRQDGKAYELLKL